MKTKKEILKKLNTRIYRLMDNFLVEAKDQNGNDRSLEKLNQDRHLFAKNMLEEISIILDEIYD